MKEKIYCFDCDKKVIPKIETKKNKYIINDEKIIVDEVVYFCPTYQAELIGNNINNALENIYNTYLQNYGSNLKDLNLETLD